MVNVENLKALLDEHYNETARFWRIRKTLKSGWMPSWPDDALKAFKTMCEGARKIEAIFDVLDVDEEATVAILKGVQRRERKENWSKYYHLNAIPGILIERTKKVW